MNLRDYAFRAPRFGLTGRADDGAVSDFRDLKMILETMVPISKTK
nr:MAG TPA: hypothetical protein [Caudoviricetes sp.]